MPAVVIQPGRDQRGVNFFMPARNIKICQRQKDSGSRNGQDERIRVRVAVVIFYRDRNGMSASRRRRTRKREVGEGEPGGITADGVGEWRVSACGRREGQTEDSPDRRRLVSYGRQRRHQVGSRNDGQNERGCVRVSVVIFYRDRDGMSASRGRRTRKREVGEGEPGGITADGVGEGRVAAGGRREGQTEDSPDRRRLVGYGGQGRHQVGSRNDGQNKRGGVRVTVVIFYRDRNGVSAGRGRRTRKRAVGDGQPRGFAADRVGERRVSACGGIECQGECRAYRRRLNRLRLAESASNQQPRRWSG